MALSDYENKLSPILIINDISKMFHDTMRDRNNRPEMRRGFAHLLYYIYLKDGRTQLELANLTLIKTSTVSVTLRNMERAGLIVRKTDPNDFRQTRVFITEKGKELHEYERKQREELENIILEGLTKEERESLRKMLIRMKDNLMKKRG